MENIAVSDVRNFALMGHTGSGKTTLADALLFKLGLNDRLGSVTAGSSLCDYTDQEKARNISIFATPFSAVYKSGGKDRGLVLIDTPGYMDFFGQVAAANSVSDVYAMGGRPLTAMAYPIRKTMTTRGKSVSSSITR